MKIFLSILQKFLPGVVLACAAYASAHAAAVSWVNADGSWNDPANWSSNPALPGPADNVTISVSGLLFTVNHDGSINTVDSLASAENLLVTAGVLTIANAYSNTAATSITFGTLVLNGVSGSTGYAQSGGSLRGTGDLTVSGVATITGGDQQGSGSTILKGATALSNLYLDAGRTLRNEGTLTQTSGNIYLNFNSLGVSIPGFATITNAAGATWVASGDFSGTGLQNFSFGDADTGAGATFTNLGTFRKSGSGASDVTNINVVFDNGGTVDVQTGVLALNSGGTHTGSFTGAAGTVQFGGGTHSLSAASSITTANVSVSAGTVDMAGSYDISGTTTVNGGTLNLTSAAITHLGSALNLSSGVLILGGANSTVNTLSQTGGSLRGTGNLTVSGVATITGGDMQGSGSTILQGATALSNVYLDAGRTLRNEGTLTQTSGTVYLNYNNTGASIPGFGTITNAAGATWVASGDFGNNGISAPDFFGPTDPSAGATFTNLGTFRKSGSGASDVTNIGVVFDNGGTVDVQTGVLSLSNGGTHTGSFTGAAGTLQFGGGTHSLSAASSITTQNVTVSAGTVETAGTYNIGGTTAVNGGTLNLTGATLSNLGSALNLSSGVLILGGANSTANTLNQSGGSLRGTGDLTVSGVATIAGGDQQGSGHTILQGATALSNLYLDAGRTLRNEGTLTQTSGTVYLNYNNTGASIPGFGTITNAAGATWVASGDFGNNGISAPDFFGPTDPSAGATFTNLGTFRKSGSGATDVTSIGVVFDNGGTVDVQTGVLSLSNGGTHTGSFATAVGSTLQFAGGTHNLNNASAVNSLGRILISSGTVNTTGTLGSGGLLELQGGVLSAGGAVNTASYTQSGGSLQGTGNLTVSGVATITGGDQQGSGSTILQGATALSNLYLDAGRTLRNEGTLTQTSGTVYLNYNNSGASIPGFGTITNAAGATWVASGDFGNNGISAPDFFGPTDPSAGATFTNLGTFRKSGSGASDVTNIGVVFDNGGTVDVQTGVLSLNNGGTHTGSFATVAGSTLQFGGGTHNLNNASAVNSLGRILISSGAVNTTGTLGNGGLLELQGGVLNAGGAVNTASYTQSGGSLQGTGNLTVSGVATIAGGDQQGSGSTILQGATALSNIYLDAGRTLRNEGTLTQTSGTVYLNYNVSGASIPGFGTITNAAGATWVASGDFGGGGISAPDFFGPTDPSAGATFTNLGTFRKSGSGATDVTSIGVVFDNGGTVDVQTGVLSLSNGGTHTGSFATAVGSTLQFAGGTHNLNNASAVNSLGRILISSGTVNTTGTLGSGGLLELQGGVLSAGGAVNTASYTQSGGSLQGTGNLTVSGVATITGGDQQGSGSTILQGATALSNLYLDAGRTLRNEGTLTQTSGTVYLNYNNSGASIPGFGTITNAAGATWVASGDFGNNGISAPDFFGPTDPSAGATFTNLGTFRKSGSGATDVTNISVVFDNEGLIEVQTGTLTLSSKFTNTGTARVQPGATLISNGNFTNFDSVTSTLTGGTYDVFGASGSAGIFSFAGADIVTNAGTILLDGPNSSILNYNTSGDALANFATNTGSFTIQNGRNFTTAAAFDNPGTVQIGPSSTFTSTGAFTNGGTLAMRGGVFNALSLANSGEVNGHGTVNPNIQNGGSVRAFGGTLTAVNGITAMTGTVQTTVQTDAGGTLMVGAASSTDTLINNGSLVLGTNSITVTNAYQNANFGTGNSFNRRANVTGTGQILASGASAGNAQILAGDFSPTPTNGNATINFGSLRVGDSVTKNYQIGNAISGGPSLFGAIQTAVNGGNITDARLSGAGVTASSWGQIAPGNSTGNLGVTFAASSSGSLAGQQVHIQNNFDNTNSQNLAFQGKAYTAAVAQQNTTSVDFGIVHRGDSIPTQAVSVTNAAPVTALNDVLLAQAAGAAAPFTASGNLGSGLPAGQSNNTSLLVGLNTATAGVFNGTATFTAASHNADMVDLPLPDLSVSLSGQVNNFAASAFGFSGGAGSFSQSGSIFTLDFGTRTQGSGTLTSTLLALNSAAGPADLLNGSFEFVDAQDFGASGFNPFTDVAAGQSFGPLTLSFNTSSAGAFSDTILLHGIGHNSSGFSGAIGDITLNVEGTVAAVPEPSAYALMLVGLALLGWRSRARPGTRDAIAGAAFRSGLGSRC